MSFDSTASRMDHKASASHPKGIGGKVSGSLQSLQFSSCRSEKVFSNETPSLIQSNTREVDVVSRYGGEEFAIAFPETSESGRRTGESSTGTRGRAYLERSPSGTASYLEPGSEMEPLPSGKCWTQPIRCSMKPSTKDATRFANESFPHWPGPWLHLLALAVHRWDLEGPREEGAWNF